MIGNLYINDKDAWQHWSSGLVSGSYSNLLVAAPPKEYASHDTRSQDGKHYFVSNPRVSEREIILSFGIVCDSTNDYLAKYNALIEELSKGVIFFRVTKLKTTYKLLFGSVTELSAGNDIRTGTFTIRFIEPNPKDRIKL